MADLTFMYGSMNSGKSIDLMREAYNFNENGLKVLIIKSKRDTKGEDHLESRIGIRRKVDILLGQDESLLDYMDLILDNIACLFIDEVQFMTPKQIEDLWYISKILDIPVKCFGLKADFKAELFEGSKRLLELCDVINELETLCKCGNKAKFNARFVNDKLTLEGDTILIDGSNSKVEYKPLCGNCYIKAKEKYYSNELSNSPKLKLIKKGR